MAYAAPSAQSALALHPAVPICQPWVGHKPATWLRGAGLDAEDQPADPQRPRSDVRAEERPLRVGRLVFSVKPAPRSEEQRLNSSHPSISYAVFCLKKKKERDNR